MSSVTLWQVISSGEILPNLAEFMDAISAIEVTRASAQFYTGIPRNSSVGVQIWRRYLADDRYQWNRLIFAFSRDLVGDDRVSRANYKLILGVLVQKNGFMKISRLKSLCSSGKLSQPILPHKGAWRCLTRLDQFALKRAAGEQKKSDVVEISTTSLAVSSRPGLSATGKFVSRICGRKGEKKSEMVRNHLVSLLSSSSEQLTWLIDTLVKEGNFLGVREVLEVALSVVSADKVSKLVFPPLHAFRTNLGDTILHLIVKDKDLNLAEKISILNFLKNLPSCASNLINAVNLSHETPLLLLMNSGLEERVQLSEVLKDLGADASICDVKGNFFKLE